MGYVQKGDQKSNKSENETETTKNRKKNVSYTTELKLKPKT